MRRLCAVALALVCGGATPAWAHQEISPGNVPTGRPAFLILSAANERSVDLTSVSIVPPSGGQFGHASKDPAGWTSTLSHTNVRWTGGAVRPQRFEQFGFDVEPFAQPGTATFRVTFGYADGTTQDVEVPLAVGGGTGSSGPSVTAAPTPTTAAATGSSEDTVPAAAPAPGDADGGDSGDGLATLAIVLSVVALAASVGSAVASRRRPGDRPAPAAAGSGQDW